MTVKLAYPHIVKEEGKPARLESHARIRVAQIVMDYLVHGWSPEEMCRQHPYMQLAEAHAAMAYYYDHQAEIDHEIQDEIKLVEEDYARAAPSPFLRRLQSENQVRSE